MTQIWTADDVLFAPVRAINGDARLVATSADPGAATVLTEFAAKSAVGFAWPPKGRDTCWCASGSRYRDCGGRPN